MQNNDAAIKEAFEQPLWYLTSTAYNIRIRCETIREFLGDRSCQHLLDIGCGDGSLSLPLLTHDSELTLLDRSRNMLQRAVSRIPENLARNVTAVNADFMSAELPREHYDLVICVGVMAYVSDASAFLEKVASLLCAGGTLILECTDGSHSLSGFTRAYLAMRRRTGGGGLFRTVQRSSASLLGVVNEMGFEMRSSFRYSLPLPGVRKLLPQAVSYSTIRGIFGSSRCNRFPWLGNECLFELTLAGRRNSPDHGSSRAESGELVISSGG